MVTFIYYCSSVEAGSSSENTVLSMCLLSCLSSCYYIILLWTEIIILQPVPSDIYGKD